MSTTTKAPAAAEADAQANLRKLIAEYQSLTGSSVNRFGDWSTGFVVTIGDDSFAVRPTTDGVSIEPRERTPLLLAYAHDAEVLIQEARRGLRDSVLFHKLGAGSRPSLAAAVVEAMVENQTQRAIGAVTSSNGGRWGG
jgi:hypothetical protein